MSSSQGGPLMSVQAVLITSLGVISSIFTTIMNVYFIKKIGKTRHKMILFFYRLFLDVTYNVFACAYMTFSILYSFFTEELREQQVFIVYVGFPLQTVGAIRTVVALAISLERVLAIYTPIMFHNHRHLCPSILILMFSIFMGLFENLILYLFCTLNIPAIPRDCAVMRCSIDNCFFNYWTTDRSVLFALNFAFSGLLSTRLLLFKKSHRRNAGEEQSKINHIALIDAANVFLCDFLPTFSNYVNQYPFFSFKNIGPYVYIIKLIGSAVESYFIFKILKRKSARTSVVVTTTRTLQNSTHL
ncbi:Serpentine Receptor, class BC (Class B-like) [Caenorhabditis elegans]|uniref:Serpentine Receptor, class BC (Class B-like) n=1 Tax=Caenorhabditis elegans TaxID=6239 RepID=Q5DX30_CAEEL|nr:Serpentine Receptor, class BC (Class B-like) [Caenorhabditis elegans]CCD63005.1 Serpentine Receptor, class BC (Class B-like) [Caenorhabditis elegans]|eukprot:NP_504925.2 Serpentine Receptor, class BC (class B-like) [Caenorhabditis elegans]